MEVECLQDLEEASVGEVEEDVEVAAYFVVRMELVVRLMVLVALLVQLDIHIHMVYYHNNLFAGAAELVEESFVLG